ncbi:hypothetical protein [Dactylosporangium roseum]|nr:hypothetical protein [Dactylosporangium roseum]
MTNSASAAQATISLASSALAPDEADWPRYAEAFATMHRLTGD